MTALPPVVMLVAKAFQRPDIPRARQEARALLEAGYPVYVLAWDRNTEFPAVENIDGATVHSLSPVNLKKFSRFRLALGGIIFQTILVFETLKLIARLKQRPIVHAHDINTLLFACFLRMFRLCSALVYDCREFTYGAYREWFNPLVAFVVRTIEERCLRHVDAIITVSDSIATYLRRFNPTTETIYNCPMVGDLPKLTKDEVRVHLGLPLDAFIVSSVGTIRYDCRFDLLLDVASLIGEQNVHFLIVGDGPLAPEIRHAAREAGHALLTVLPRVSRETALSYVLASDLTWAIYQNGSLNARVGLPWKFFESLACGVPVIVEPRTLRAKLVREFKCGVVLEKDDPKHVSKLVLYLAKHPDQHREMCAKAKYTCEMLRFNWETMSTKLINVYRRLGPSAVHAA